MTKGYFIYARINKKGVYMGKWQQSKGYNKFLISVLLLSIFCAGCGNKNENISIISKKPCTVEIKEVHTTVYKRPQYPGTIKDGYLVEDKQKGKIKEDSITTYFKDYLKNEKWAEHESLDNKTPYVKTVYTGKNIYMQAIKVFATRVTGPLYLDVNGTRLKNKYPRAEVLFDGWKTTNLSTPYSLPLLKIDTNGSLIKKNNNVNGIKCDLYSYGPSKSCNNHHCTYHKAEVCYSEEYNMALKVKIISKTDISDKNYNVEKSINELIVTKLEFADISNNVFARPKGLILPDYLINKLAGSTNKQKAP